MHGCENSRASPQQKYNSRASSLSPNTQWKKIVKVKQTNITLEVKHMHVKYSIFQ